jgi:DNA adenine methylase
MGFTNSPLRYPGGKTRLANFVELIMNANDLVGGDYVEPYAGAAGIAWRLLLDDFVTNVHLNDIDRSLYAFWLATFDETEALCKLIHDTTVNMATWRRQKAIMEAPDQHSQLERGFATFFLNRTNRSGILLGGVIGGQRQRGEYRLNARFNKRDLIKRVEKIASFRHRVRLHAMDAAQFIVQIVPTIPARSLIYLDPPYVTKGEGLYENHYGPDDHATIARLVTKKVKQNWLVTYDDHPSIRSLYAGLPQWAYSLTYSAAERYAGKELMIFSEKLIVPILKAPVGLPRPRKASMASQLPLSV